MFRLGFGVPWALFEAYFLSEFWAPVHGFEHCAKVVHLGPFSFKKEHCSKTRYICKNGVISSAKWRVSIRMSNNTIKVSLTSVNRFIVAPGEDLKEYP